MVLADAADVASPYGTLAEYGLLGACCVLLLMALSWMVREYLRAAKDYKTSIETVTANQIVAHRESDDKNIKAQKESTDRFIDLHQEQSRMFQAMHDKTLERLRKD